ncbi:MAG: VWA domain-containing protein, partial [Acidobacteriota bacterium]
MPAERPGREAAPRAAARRAGAKRIAACLVLALAAAPAHASEGDADAEAAGALFEGRASVTLVEVPVQVISRAGEPVRGLGAEDFSLLDNGVPQKIESLEIVDLEGLRPDRAETRAALGSLPASARRHFLLLFDLTFSRPGAIVKARSAARRFVLESLHPTDLAAVATLSLERGPQLLVAFTPDRAQLARAIDTLGAPGLVRRAGPADPLRLVLEHPDLGGADEASDDGGLGAEGGAVDLERAVAQHLAVISDQRDRSQRAFARGRIAGWARSMAETARSLAAIEGRKHLIFFSEGFDGSLLFGRDLGRDAAAAATDQRLREDGTLGRIDLDRTLGSAVLQRDIAAMLREFRRADCRIQAVDLAGLRVEDAARGSSAPGDAREALFHLAEETGGVLLEGTNDLAAGLEKVLGRTAVTYLLTFYPGDLE